MVRRNDNYDYLRDYNLRDYLSEYVTMISFHKSTFDLILCLDYPNLQGLVPRPLPPLLILSTCRGWS